MSTEPVQHRGVISALFTLGLAILFWSSVPLLLKYFTRQLDAWTVNGLRYLFAAMFWAPYVLRHRKEVPAGRNIWRDALPPAGIHLVGQALFGLTPYYNSATIINFVSRTAFLFTTLSGFLLLREERVLGRSPFFWLGFLATTVGLVALYLGGFDAGSTTAIGMAVLVGTSACWGIYSVLIRRYMHPYSIRLSFGVISLYAAPGLLALMFGVGHWREALKLGPGYWALIWLSAILGIALGHTLFYRAIHVLGPVTSEGSLLLIPFLTAILASYTLGEHLGGLQWAGGLVLITGCALLLRAKLRLSQVASGSPLAPEAEGPVSPSHG